MRAARSILSAAVLSAAIVSAGAQPATYPERVKQFTAEQNKAIEERNARKQKSLAEVDAMIDKLAACKRQARAQKLHFLKRSRFIKKCTAE